MKIKDEFPNFKKGLLFFINDKGPVLASDDSKKISYFIPLKNFNKGFDYYELTRLNNGNVYFSIVTMLGFKTIVQSDSEIFSEDLSESEWGNLIFQISINHFNKEEYLALKNGYVKKKSGGCMIGLLTILGLAILIIGIIKN